MASGRGVFDEWVLLRTGKQDWHPILPGTHAAGPRLRGNQRPPIL